MSGMHGERAKEIEIGAALGGVIADTQGVGTTMNSYVQTGTHGATKRSDACPGGVQRVR